jgi:hypothetical protein
VTGIHSCRATTQLTINRVAHDADFRAAKKDWETFVESLTPKISERDGTIPELPVKDLVCFAYPQAQHDTTLISLAFRSSAYTEIFDSARTLFRTRYVHCIPTNQPCPVCDPPPDACLCYCDEPLVSHMPGLTNE